MNKNGTVVKFLSAKKSVQQNKAKKLAEPKLDDAALSKVFDDLFGKYFSPNECPEKPYQGCDEIPKKQKRGQIAQFKVKEKE